RFFSDKAAHGLDTHAAEARTKQLLHGVQLGLERFAVDSVEMNHAATPRYPGSMTELVRSNYLLGGIYANPFTAASATELNALDIPFGWSAIAPGNFSYLKQYAADGQVSGYVLVAYGALPENGGDINGDGINDGV